MALYVPQFNNNNCVILYDSSTIRVYETQPTFNSVVNYTDYYINSGYISNVGSETFGNYSVLPSCRNDITNDFYYRLDFDKICIIFMVIIILCYFLAFKPISRIFGRYFKL